MDYPLTLTFKVLAVAPQVTVTDANERLIFYVKQKLFKLRESVTVFADAEQTQPLYTIEADRVLDFSARYDFTDRRGMDVGAIRRQGARSIWRAHYDILDGDTPIFTVREENPWVKLVDSIAGEVPILGLLTGYFLHPAYVISRPDGEVVVRLEKQPAFWEGRFAIEKHGAIAANEEKPLLLGLLMMILLERQRG